MALSTTPLPADRKQDDFDSIFLAHWNEIYGMLYRTLGDEAEDVAQDVFLKLHTRPPKPGSNYRAWLYKVATREGLNRLRSRKRQSGLLGLLTNFRVDRTEGPEREVQARDDQQRVREVLGRMRPLYAKALLLRYEGFEYSELAQVTGIKTSSVGTVLARAEQQFARLYTEIGGER